MKRWYRKLRRYWRAFFNCCPDCGKKRWALMELRRGEKSRVPGCWHEAQRRRLACEIERATAEAAGGLK
jgi:hypothetical protein